MNEHEYMLCPACGHAAIDHGERICGQETSMGDCHCELSAYEIAKIFVSAWQAEALAARNLIALSQTAIHADSIRDGRGLYETYLAARVPEPKEPK